MAVVWITVAEASKQSGYHAETLRELIRDGRIKGRKFATVWQVSRSSLMEYLREQEQRGEKRGPKPR